MDDDPVTIRHFDKHEKTDDERHREVLLMIEDIKAKHQGMRDDVAEKHRENRSEFRDVKLLLGVLIVATAPQLITFISRLMVTGGAH